MTEKEAETELMMRLPEQFLEKVAGFNFKGANRNFVFISLLNKAAKSLKNHLYVYRKYLALKKIFTCDQIPLKCVSYQPRVWNYFQGFHTIVLNDLAPPSPASPSLVSRFDRRHTGRLRKRDSLRVGRGSRRSQIIRQRESLVLYK